MKQMLVTERFKPLAEIIDIAEHSNELRLAHSDPPMLTLGRG
jgi:hypothetical protein